MNFSPAALSQLVCGQIVHFRELPDELIEPSVMLEGNVKQAKGFFTIQLSTQKLFL